jgi:hypothetical protein
MKIPPLFRHTTAPFAAQLPLQADQAARTEKKLRLLA